MIDVGDNKFSYFQPTKSGYSKSHQNQEKDSESDNSSVESSEDDGVSTDGGRYALPANIIDFMHDYNRRK